jgi:hypothetical protein
MRVIPGPALAGPGAAWCRGGGKSTTLGDLDNHWLQVVEKDTVTVAKARHSRLDCTPGCAVEAAVSLIYGKWKAVPGEPCG